MCARVCGELQSFAVSRYNTLVSINPSELLIGVGLELSAGVASPWMCCIAPEDFRNLVVSREIKYLFNIYSM